ncbi:ATP-binding protein [Hansschlegelia zhihuaiae]|uniref:histidine kinase n=1 Tax=Hansschlegelia zhihuaiae TaxID=405005 RepID=A0A4V1KJI6_9HYPH|nr:ATP-binding protein [Hansschlegelia zhihuaiae]RXF74322.1 response regulator [Hansschlegelia zhihuaiae]
MTTPDQTSSHRMIVGICLALAAAAIAVWGFAVSAGAAGLGPSAMTPNAGIAILAACGGWFALQRRSRAATIGGYALVSVAAAISIATLVQHVARIDLGVDTLIGRELMSPATGHPGRPSAAVGVSLLLAAISIALTRFRSALVEELRQFARIAGLAPPLFALALQLYDPAALDVIDGFEQTALSTSLALTLLLLAVGFDRAAASLRWQIASIGVVTVAPLVALTVHFASAERESALAAASERLAATARIGAERQDAVIAQTRQMLSFLARSSAIRSFGPTCNRELAENLTQIPFVRSLSVIDRAGVVRCADQASKLPLQVADRDYVRDAFGTGRFTVSGFIISRANGMPRIAAALPAPEGDAAEFLVVAFLDLEALAGPLAGIGHGEERGETVTLVDRGGVVIAREPRDDNLIGVNLADATFVTQALANPGQPFEAAELGGEATVYYASRVLDGEGTLIVGMPRREVVRPVDKRLNHRLLLISGILAASLALGVLGSETLVLRPLRRLTAYAGRLEDGDLAARPDVRATGEVGALGRALAVSAAAIEDRERRLAEAEALFRGLFDHSPDSKAVIRVESDGGFRVETWNAAAAAATGLSPGEVVGRSPHEVFPGSRGEAIEHDLRRTLALGRVTTIEREPVVQGLPTVFEMVQVPLRGADGSIERIFLSARDISERKRVERLKNEFVSTVSHELRTPLTSIAGSLGLLSGGAAGPLSDRARHLITIAHSNSLRLVRLINDILDIEKIEAGRMTFDLRSLVVTDVVAQAIGGLKSYADEYGVEVELAPRGDELMVYGDEDRLTQVVTNLLSNAIKYSPRGGLVTASIFAERDAVAIVVKDCGPGIPEAFRGRLFTKFAQADGSDSRRKGGTGLGLAIVREIVERHAGAVTYRTEAGLGTEFEVRLPRHVMRDRTAPPVLPEHPARPKILICEDDALIAAILAEQMRDVGFEGVTADTMRAAVQAVGRDEFEAALIDLSLPDGDGLSLIRALRALPKGRNLPVFVVSADAERGRRDVRAADLDVKAWLEKPVDTGRLLRLLRQRVGAAPRPRILHVEDDRDLCNVVSAAIAPIAEVVSVTSVAGARRELQAGEFDLAILDVALEDGSGLELLRLLNGADGARRTPIIIFSARDAEREVVAQAEAALTKSRTSLGALVDAVRRVVGEAEAAESPPKRSYG